MQMLSFSPTWQLLNCGYENNLMRMQAQDRKAVQLYYGTRDSDTTAYKDLDDSWKAAGVETIHVHSSDDQGYVQDVFSQVQQCC